MSAVRIEARLRELVRAGALAKSACSRELTEFVSPLLDAGVLAWENRGPGRILSVRDDATLGNFVARHFPMLAADLPPGVSQRVAAVARYRDSKALPCDTPDLITVRAWSDTALWKDGEPVAAAEATRAHGVFSFALTPGHGYELRGTCALIEGPELLLGFENLPVFSECSLAIYGGGRISQRVLAWLASQTAPAFRLVHCPDYDPVGLNEFVRLRSQLGIRVTLYLPNDLKESFARFSNPDLLRRLYNQSLLVVLRINPCPEVRTVLELIEHHHAGLEHEKLLLPAAARP